MDKYLSRNQDQPILFLEKGIREEFGVAVDVGKSIAHRHYGRETVLVVGAPFNVDITLEPFEDDLSYVIEHLRKTEYWQKEQAKRQRFRSVKRYGVPKRSIGRKR